MKGKGALFGATTASAFMNIGLSPYTGAVLLLTLDPDEPVSRKMNYRPNKYTIKCSRYNKSKQTIFLRTVFLKDALFSSYDHLKLPLSYDFTLKQPPLICCFSFIE